MATGSYSGGIAQRYATAVFDIAKGEDSLDALERDVASLRAALDESADLRELLTSPIYGRDQQRAGIGAVADKMGLGPTMGNALRLMATKRRLFAVPALLTTLDAMIADARGEVTAEVTSARPLTDAQRDSLAQSLRKTVGKDVKISQTVDEGIIGGLIVKVGSKMIDTSIRSKLTQLKSTMKEAG